MAIPRGAARQRITRLAADLFQKTNDDGEPPKPRTRDANSVVAGFIAIGVGNDGTYRPPERSGIHGCTFDRNHVVEFFAVMRSFCHKGAGEVSLTPSKQRNRRGGYYEPPFRFSDKSGVEPNHGKFDVDD